MRLRYNVPLKIALCAALMAFLGNVSAAAVPTGGRAAAPSFVPGQILITVPANTSAAQVQSLAQSAGATVKESLGTVDKDNSWACYLLQLTLASPTSSDTLTAVQNLKSNPLVHFAGPDKLLYPTQVPAGITPNDPLYTYQWDMRLINMPAAWLLQQGSSNVTVCVLDDGVDVTHPEFAGRVLTGYNAADGSTNVMPDTPTSTLPIDETSHGTHVAGIAMATGNNNIGIAGVAMQNVKLLPVKAVDANLLFPEDYLVKAMQFINAQKPTVVNMSLGGPATSDTYDPTDPFAQDIIKAESEGIVVVIAAGNNYLLGNPPFYPANTPGVVCVTSCGPNKEHAVYSEVRPYSTICAPGGDDPTFSNPLTLQITSCWQGGIYGQEQGTSMAAPHVAGAIALLLSVPGVTPDQAISAIESTADTVGQTVPNPTYGYGVLDVYAALLKVSVSTLIISPQGTGGLASSSGTFTTPQPVDTLNPMLKFQVSLVPLSSLSITVDGNPVPSTTIQNSVISGTPGERYIIGFHQVLNPGSHTVVITGVNPTTGQTATDTRTFTVSPHVMPAGRSLVSIPYLQAGAIPQTYFGLTFRLARWESSSAQYAFYNGSGQQDPNASFNPPSNAPFQNVTNQPVAPLGLGYFLDAQNATPILTTGVGEDSQPISIPLQPGWNMIGDPMDFAVCWNALLVTDNGVTMPIQDAASKGYINASLYSFVNGQYTFDTLPAGSLQPWLGNWVFVDPTYAPNGLTLVVPPTPTATTSRAAAVTGPSLGSSGWYVQLQATAGSMADSYNFIGESSRAINGPDQLKVPKPPMLSPFVTVEIQHNDWGSQSGVYAEDIRSRSIVPQAWNVLVNTDKTDVPVTLSWLHIQSVPRNIRLTLKDLATGQTYDMRTRSSVTFNSGNAKQAHEYVIRSVTQPLGAHLIISGLSVAPTRGGGYGINYSISENATVEVTIVSASGNVVATVGSSRAITAGNTTLVWNGRDQKGTSVPSGAYIAKVHAIVQSSDQSANAVVPFIVIR